MYLPTSFAESDLSRLHDFIDQQSFATLVSTASPEPFASHLPLLLERPTGSTGPGHSGKLFGHLARANPHWRIAAGQPVLAMFHGPHAYISPGWVTARNAVPTWNYVAVHAFGTLQLISDPHATRRLLTETVARYESHRQHPWSMSAADSEYIEQMTAAVVAFEIVIDRLEGKWKLSQNHPLERREQIVAGLREVGDPNSLEIADLMSQPQHRQTHSS